MKMIQIVSSTALVPIGRPFEARSLSYGSRPDAPFVAQLIATAAGASQTRVLRRTTQADALTGYRCVTARSTETLRSVGGYVSLVA